jgi:aspartyl-tRNA(Asn)/glutamyl-tRNA(Gln) amidotransferase subunit C
MKKEDIEHLALLSRIALREGEAEALAREITTILGYVSEVNEISGNTAQKKEAGALFNVMRPDIATNEPGSFREALLEAAPERHGNYVQVKKILGDKE